MRLSRKQPIVTASLTLAAAMLAAGFAGCALPGGGYYGPGELKAGDTEQAVVHRMGTPTERQTTASGQRLLYVRGPAGQHTFMVELDAQARVTRLYNALEPNRRAQVQPQMSREEVRNLLGPPAEMRGLAMEGRSLWAWRFPTYDCEWFVATFNAQGKVLDAGTMTDPRCDVDRD